MATVAANHGSIGPTIQRVVSKGGQQHSGQSHGRKDRDVDLGMAKEPEQILPQKRRTGGMVQNHAVDDINGREEEAGAEVTIAEQHSTRRQQNTERGHHHAGGHKPGPHRQRHLHPLHLLQAAGENGGDDTDCTE